MTDGTASKISINIKIGKVGVNRQQRSNAFRTKLNSSSSIDSECLLCGFNAAIIFNINSHIRKERNNVAFLFNRHRAEKFLIASSVHSITVSLNEGFFKSFCSYRILLYDFIQ